ncbi:alcohol dehydrogenase catalytic domain-containing protein [Actinomadura xylanilytica]|uniref:alcohol dehydrogenase catalytic domain-containing protein n=1 Tax=Actinomadura xylanilytica TaxID=887459 RepID=UPI00255B1BEE|nr:alcohol dehydrogenase catalytic domain-containing protein [Actinomadura xylanilytica]MDL4771536.1 alcohol dehydrogenase catalytic domain-containing protein [Actinomadura xylanilytica]
MRMRAAVLREYGAPLEVTNVHVAEPAYAEVRVRVAASGICGSDVRAMAGGSATVRSLPCILGHEAAGVVDAVGPGVTAVAPGDHVIIAMNGPCGLCRNCGRGRPQLCTDPSRLAAIDGLTADGGTRLRLADGAGGPGPGGGAEVRPYIGIGAFAEYAVVRERMCVPVARDLPLDLLALTACGVVTGVGAVFNTARVEPGSSVLVVGCGGVGLSVIQGAAVAGATEIIAADLLEAKLTLAKELGATHTIVADDLTRRVADLVPGGVDYAFDATGSTAVPARALAATCPGGTAVMVGIPPLDRMIGIPPDLLSGHRRLMGTQGGDAMPDRDLPRLVDLYRAGRLDLERMAGERVTLDGLDDAVGRVRAGAAARSLVLFA